MATTAQFDQNLWDDALFDQNDGPVIPPTLPTSKKYGCKIVVAPRYSCKVTTEDVL